MAAYAVRIVQIMALQTEGPLATLEECVEADVSHPAEPSEEIGRQSDYKLGDNRSVTRGRYAMPEVPVPRLASLIPN